MHYGIGSREETEVRFRSLVHFHTAKIPALVTLLMVGIFSLLLIPACAQDIDTVPSSASRSSTSIAEEIADPSERAAFIEMCKRAAPEQMLKNAESFLRNFPQSAFLAHAYEVAALSSFDLQQYQPGLQYAQKSLRLLPEQPELLVSTADVEARAHQTEAAIRHAQEALADLDRFGRPAEVAAENWPEIQRKLKAWANFAAGRAFLSEAVDIGADSKQNGSPKSTSDNDASKPDSARRDDLLKKSRMYLSEAQRLNPSDAEIGYLLGLALVSSGNLKEAATEFAAIADGKNAFASKALGQLHALHKSSGGQSGMSFEEFVANARRSTPSQPQPHQIQATPAQANAAEPAAGAQLSATSGTRLPAYAGSQSCRGCHAAIYNAWRQTGMAKMLRPYAFENVAGDFQNNNEFYLGDEALYEGGKLTISRSQDNARSLFARMVVRDGRHYFDILESDGKWHSYPVDYTIGSKFQQAYATRLANGQIHVFPIQYNLLSKHWVNHWKIIDSSKSERADPHTWEKLDDSTSYQANCAECHASQVRNTKSGKFASENIEFSEPGVNCEMCHGPSAQHALEMSTGQFYAARPLDPPVRFHELNNVDFVRICSQCHMQSAIRTPGPGGELNYSRAGEFFPQYTSLLFQEFSRKGFYKDGRFRQSTFIVEALERSQCFRKGQVSCGSCHEVHGHDAASNPTSLRFRDEPDRMCIGCHIQFADASRAEVHTHHPAASEGSRCVSCHMPRIMDALLFRTRTHEIDDVPEAEMTTRFGQQESPNACLLCHQQKNAAWVQQKLSAWKQGRVEISTAGR